MTTTFSTGFRTFVIIWAGQTVSRLGTAMTRFALLIWTYQQTGAATSVALLGFFSFLPYILLSPFAGVMVDRLPRRLVMMVADLGAGVMTVALLTLYASDQLAIWHLYVAEALTGIFDAFQAPAYSAATTMLVDKTQYDRINGMRSLSQSIPEVGAPFLAGALLPWIDLHGVMWIDVVSFVVAVATLFFVYIPDPKAETQLHAAEESIGRKLGFGFRYIAQRPGLLGLLLIFVGINLFAALTYYAILPTMILARSGNDEFALGLVQGILGVGGIIGGVIYSTWRLPLRRIHLVLGGAGISFLLGDLLFAVGRNATHWSIAAFLAAIFIPFISSANNSIWQSKVPAAVQGRVFSIRGMAQQLGMPIGYLVAGPLADRVMEPAMRAGGSLSGLFGWLVGTGPGAGMALMFVGTALFGMLMSLSGYLFRSVREVEES